ncbi:hypothetical protein L209DRAFT_474571 [Thermothelomyces heterothallicus CBS 203.75]
MAVCYSSYISTVLFLGQGLGLLTSTSGSPPSVCRCINYSVSLGWFVIVGILHPFGTRSVAFWLAHGCCSCQNLRW